MDYLRKGKISLICKNCTKSYFRKPYMKNLSKYCSRKCQNGFGKNSLNWKGGKKMDGFGYILIKMREHPFADNQGYIREHRLIMEQQLGRFLTSKEKVHHINHIKTDNRIGNLQIVSNSSHSRYHNLKNPTPRDIKTGRFINK